MKLCCIPALSLAFLLSGCNLGRPTPDIHPTATEKTPTSKILNEKTEPKPAIPDLALRQRLFLPDDRQTVLPEASENIVYSFKANALPVTQALVIFARTYHLNIIVNPDVITGSVTVDFHDIPFDQAMKAILHATGYYWHRDGKLIFVEARETRQFELDFLASNSNYGYGTNRGNYGSGANGSGTSTGGGTSSGNFNSGTSTGSGTSSGNYGSGASNGNYGNRTRRANYNIWNGLERKLKILLSDKGTLVVSRLTGIIQVTDAHTNVQAVAKFIRKLRHTISRQVEIDMKILEVTLSDNTALGIDWSRLNIGKIAFSTANSISSPAGGFAALSSALTINTGGNIKSVITALSEQGDVKIISQPRIRTLNNQPALVKVGTDRTFITQETTTTTGTSSTTSVGFTQDIVPEGLELNITPQISADGWIILEVKPKITRVSSVTEAKDSNGIVLSSGPNLDVRETSSLVRIQDGQTAVVGGLIQTIKSNTGRGVPALSKIPLLGYLFKGSVDISKRTELVIFLTPHLIGPSTDSANNNKP